MNTEIKLALLCCNANVSVEFRHQEAPYLQPGNFRKNVTCPACQRLVIVSLSEEGPLQRIEQELVDV